MGSFSVVMRGYACRQVDHLFARIDGTLGSGPVTGDPVTAAELRAVRLNLSVRGYAPGEVDEALSAALRELERRDS